MSVSTTRLIAKWIAAAFQRVMAAGTCGMDLVGDYAQRPCGRKLAWTSRQSGPATDEDRTGGTAYSMPSFFSL
ncbi:hypothetical protein GCM10023307_19780 [Lysobacter hankyongensis]|uniref:Uncharacterized protein n=1 Tax=Lysobacter hankyongensis TaxID=1176535 RepID=A0ABP9BHT6_9GAMM